MTVLATFITPLSGRKNTHTQEGVFRVLNVHEKARPVGKVKRSLALTV